MIEICAGIFLATHYQVFIALQRVCELDYRFICYLLFLQGLIVTYDFFTFHLISLLALNP